MAAGIDGGVEGGRQDALVFGQQVVGKFVEVADPADHGGAGDDLVATQRELAEQVHVLGVALHQLIAGIAVIAALDGTVFAEVVDADNLVLVAQELGHQVAGDEAGRAGDEHLHKRMPCPRIPQMSTTVRPSTARF